jgi:AraC family ethanolamine operon transcriptional activator
MPAALRNASTEIILRPLPAVLEALRHRIRSRLATGGASDREELLRSVSEALAGSPMTAAQRPASMAAARMVRTCHEIVLSGHPDHPLRIEELCLRLHTSRRTLQGSFNRVTATSPVVYMRNLRLNAARQRLMSSAAKELSVSQAAAEAGFDHLGHFAGEYKALFGEVPSQTPRATRPQSGYGWSTTTSLNCKTGARSV